MSLAPLAASLTRFTNFDGASSAAFQLAEIHFLFFGHRSSDVGGIGSLIGC
jgi:hypothetical protein